MLAQIMINSDIPFLKPTDTGQKALELMETFKISDLPIVEKNEYRGIVSEKEIFDYELENKQFKDAKVLFRNFYLNPQSHLFDVLHTFKKYNTTAIPVVEKKRYLGIITPLSVIKYLSDLPSSNPDTVGIMLRTTPQDYSPTQISNIIETTKSKLLTLIYDTNQRPPLLFLKVKTYDLESLMQAFEHYGYSPEFKNISKTKYDELYKERLENLISYLKI